MQNVWRVKLFQKLKTFYNNQCVLKMVKNIDPQDDKN